MRLPIKSLQTLDIMDKNQFSELHFL